MPGDPMFGRLVLGLMLASLMLPASALLIPAYLTVSDLRLLNTPWALWLPAAANAFNIYVLKRFYDQIPDVRTVNPRVSEAIAHVVARMTKKKREDRFASAAEVARALAPFAAAEPTVSQAA